MGSQTSSRQGRSDGERLARDPRSRVGTELPARAALADWDTVADNQDRVHDLLAELSPRYRVDDSTRFKFVLRNAVPRAGTNARLWRILENHPDLYGHILGYFGRYQRLPNKDSLRLVKEVQTEREQEDEHHAEFVVPHDRTKLKACSRCFLLKTEQQWKADSKCENCGVFEGDVMKYVTKNFDGYETQ